MTTDKKMEKLLSEQYETQGHQACHLIGNRTKISSSAKNEKKIFFRYAAGKNNFSQPYSGCFILVNQ